MRKLITCWLEHLAPEKMGWLQQLTPVKEILTMKTAQKKCKCSTPGTDKAGKCPAVAGGGGGWAQVELTDA